MATESFLTAPINRDLIGPNNVLGSPSFMGMGMGNPYMYTNFLGGVTMPQPLLSDTYSGVRQTKFRNIKDIKNIVMGLGGGVLALMAGTKVLKWGKALRNMFK